MQDFFIIKLVVYLIKQSFIDITWFTLVSKIWIELDDKDKPSFLPPFHAENPRENCPFE